MPARIATLLVALSLAAAAWAADVLLVEDWSKVPLGAKGIPDGWKGDQVWGDPKHDFTILENDGHRVLHLRSQDESSTITKELKGKWRLKDTPILEWSWKAVALPKGADSRHKRTDDQAAQLYVVWPRFPKELRSRLIGYVWDTTAPAGLIVPSEKTSMVTYVIVRSGPAELGKWLTERRNVVEDFKKIYGEEPDNPGAISIAIDSDDTKSTAEAYFGAISFKKP
ncbi:MAG TPA: DUF3047 domain-containing protein [Methylomirabilota bacterium]|nr:DUF3047 domain-containing protein [Methylomirabilota bacterium]